MNTSKTTKLNAISALTIVSLISASAAAAPLALEGPIEAVGNGTITVMGITVAVPPDALINSPTRSLTFSDLVMDANLDGVVDPLPGRSQPGFIGGTAIINGLTASDPLNLNPGVNTAEDVFVEPAENVLLGEITQNSCITATCDGPGESFSISGTKMIRLADPRIPAGAAIDANGLVIDLSTTALGSAAAAEGYYGVDLNFYYFLVEAEGSPILCAGTGCRPADVISVARARCRDDDRIQVAGGVLDTDGTYESSVTITAFDFIYGTAPVIVDPATGEATYTLRVDISGACPANVTATYNSATTTADVDIR